MARLAGNRQLCDSRGRPLSSLAALNALPETEKVLVYSSLLPDRLRSLLSLGSPIGAGGVGDDRVTVIAPDGLSFARLEVRQKSSDCDTVFFLELADTHFGQMELSFCIIADPQAPRFDVDRDPVTGRDNCFTTLGRNIPEEVRAMGAGLFPNQTRRGLRLFADFFPLFERFVDSLNMDMIVAEPLTYDNAIRYEGYGFDYLTGRLLMQRINEGFSPDGIYQRRLDGSTPFRQPGQAETVFGRSWAIHDGILGEPWDDIRIYKMIGVHAGITTFPAREQ